jgi:hypothetical protein
LFFQIKREFANVEERVAVPLPLSGRVILSVFSDKSFGSGRDRFSSNPEGMGGAISGSDGRRFLPLLGFRMTGSLGIAPQGFYIDSGRGVAGRFRSCPANPGTMFEKMSRPRFQGGALPRRPARRPSL